MDALKDSRITMNEKSSNEQVEIEGNVYLFSDIKGITIIA